MEPHLNTHVTVAEGVMVRELGEESVLLNLNSESYFGLDDVGTRMWKALATSASIDAAYEQLLLEYDIEPEKLRADLQGLVEELARDGLIHVSHG